MAERALPLSVLLVAHDPERQLACRAALEGAGFRLRLATSAADAVRLWRSLHPDTAIIEHVLPDSDGPALVREILAMRADARIVMIASHAADGAAREAADAGASTFLAGPIDPARLIAALRIPAAPARGADGPAPQPRTASAGTAGAADPFGAAGTAARTRAPAMTDTPTATLIGASGAMEEVRRIITAVARSTATVFITGETGTGKELAAHAIHAGSRRADGPFIALNSGAIPPDLLESEIFGHIKGSFTGAIADKPGAAAAAHGGTLFLDEICEMALPLQTKLLRFLETSTVQPVGATRPRRVDVRIICATNRDPQHAVALGQFRDDLFYRLHVLPLHLPPLRERGRDIVEIAAAALDRYAAEEGKVFEGLTPAAEEALMRHAWPGNIRELLNVIRRVVVLRQGGPVEVEMLAGLLGDPVPGEHAPSGRLAASAAVGTDDDGAASSPTPVLTLAETERRAIEAALARHDGSIPRAARDLDVSPSTLYRKLASWRDDGTRGR